jgi:hypothetical protein
MSQFDFIDISSEQWREYGFVIDGQFIRLRINHPVKLGINKSGSHRIIDALGHSYYIKHDFISIKWLPYEGQPNFVA